MMVYEYIYIYITYAPSAVYLIHATHDFRRDTWGLDDLKKVCFDDV